MSPSSSIRVLLAALAALSPFFFPYPATVLLSFAASLFFPYLALGIGILTDALYLAPNAAFFPVATGIGAVTSLLAFFVRRFIKARIMGG